MREKKWGRNSPLFLKLNTIKQDYIYEQNGRL